MTRILITGNHQSLSDAIRKILLDEGQDPTTVSLDQAAAASGQLRPEIIVGILPPDSEFAIRRLGELRLVTQASVLAVGPSTDSKLVVQALRVGADDYVDEAALEQELKGALARLRGRRLTPQAVGQTVAVLGASGGCGSSTLAANLATVLAQEHNRSVLIDLKLAGGDLSSLLNLKPVYSLSDLCQNATRMDTVMFERSLVQHETGVHLLSCPRTLGEMRHVNSEGVRQVLTLARALFPHTIVDMDDCFHEEQLLTLRLADMIVLIFRLDFTSLRSVRRALDKLKESGISKERTCLVVNRYGQPKELAVAKAEDVLGLRVNHLILDDPTTMNQANINGIPAVLSAPSAKVSKSIVQLARSISGGHVIPDHPTIMNQANILSAPSAKVSKGIVQLARNIGRRFPVSGNRLRSSLFSRVSLRFLSAVRALTHLLSEFWRWLRVDTFSRVFRGNSQQTSGDAELAFRLSVPHKPPDIPKGQVSEKPQKAPDLLRETPVDFDSAEILLKGRHDIHQG